MKKVALLMTVGTGVGEDKDKKIESLAHGLLSSILHYNPDKVVFFGSEESKETVESLKKQYEDKTGKEFIDHDFVLITKIDDLDECFGGVRKVIEEYEDKYEIIIDYTSGTKTMTTAASICSMLYHKELSLVSGRRGKRGIVIPGTERIVEQNLYSAYDKYLFDKFKELFNLHQFIEAKNVLEQIVVLEERKKYRNLVEGYDLWDKFDHESAFRKLERVKDERISKNKAFLSILNREKRSDYSLVDLINNAERRISEGKYDDAVARLYRAIELIAQMKLQEYRLNDLSEGKFTLNDLKEKGVEIEKYKDCVDEKGRLNLALKKKFELLRDLEWDKANEIYLNNDKVKDLLRKRNSSILAHGLEPIDKESAENLLLEVEKIAEDVVREYGKLKEEASFPEL